MTAGISNPIPSDEYLKLRCQWANDVQGKLEGDDCHLCKNRGYTVEIMGDRLVTVECKCMTKRRSIRRIEKSGLGNLIGRCKFETFQTREPWQSTMKQVAMQFVSQGFGRWFAACGSVGAGKTHICTAICGELLNAGFEVRYMLWRDESVRLKAAVNDEEEYQRLIWPLKTVPVLYIDDLFKTKKAEIRDGKKVEYVTAADINLAFEILNYRAQVNNAVTIISSEKTLGEITSIDEGVGSRIAEKCKGYYIKLTGDKNQRLR